MTIKELSIFVQNKKGKLAAISKLMGENKISIRGFTMADTAEGYGIFRIIVDQNSRAAELLKGNGFMISETEVVAVKVPDNPGALYDVLKLFSENGINVEYIYAVVNSIIVFKTDQNLKAAAVLNKSNIPVIENTLEI